MHIAGLTWREWLVMLGLFAIQLACAAALTGVLFATGIISRPAHAHDWSGAEDPGLSQWFMGLRREDNFSCCGLGDAYPAQILVEADPNRPYEDTGVAQITDGREMNVLNNMVHRPPLVTGTQVKFAYFKMTKQKYGNPTDTAWVFLSVFEANPSTAENNSISQVYCVVPLPVGY